MEDNKGQDGQRVLYLTNNPNLGSTARILQSWLLSGKDKGLIGIVGIQKEGAFADWLAKNGIDFQINPMPWFNRLWPFRSLWQAWRLAHWAKGFGVQIIHCNEHNVYPFALVVRRFLAVPIVCHVRFAMERDFCQWAFGGSRRQPDALLWTSRQQCQDCAQAIAGLVPQEKQHLVYLGLDLKEFGNRISEREATRKQWGIQPDEIVIGTASAMKPIKRLEEFIELAARLIGKHPNAVALLAGDAPPGDEAYREKLLDRIHQKGLGRRLQWIGNQEPIEPFDHAIDIFVSASEYETFGNSVCEAMACGKPVAAYRGGSVHEIVGDAGVIRETGDLEGLISEVDSLMNDPVRRSEIGMKARKRVADQFDPAKSLDKLMEIYGTLIGPIAKYANR